MLEAWGLLSSSVLVASAQEPRFLLTVTMRVLDEARLAGGERAGRRGAWPVDGPCPVLLRGGVERLERLRSGLLSLRARRRLDVLPLLEEVLLEVRSPEVRAE